MIVTPEQCRNRSVRLIRLGAMLDGIDNLSKEERLERGQQYQQERERLSEEAYNIREARYEVGENEAGETVYVRLKPPLIGRVELAEKRYAEILQLKGDDEVSAALLELVQELTIGDWPILEYQYKGIALALVLDFFYWAQQTGD